NEDLTQSEFAALIYIPVSSVGKIGERGVNTDTVTHETYDTQTAPKGKGIANASDP
ncbi:TPA: hypothetical protein QDZ42_002491, partial [Stenotrophomonas maltophilia]|nr:hypothetical protein [Stenotrophomonas maltophilia]HDS1043823.1 hypothetical protein [Stenotrophomonas maltophilia]